MMLRHMGWTEAADLIVKGMEGAINAKTVTYDFERLMEGAKLLKWEASRRRDHQEHVITTCVKYLNGRVIRPLFFVRLLTVIKILSKKVIKTPR